VRGSAPPNRYGTPSKDIAVSIRPSMLAGAFVGAGWFHGRGFAFGKGPGPPARGVDVVHAPETSRHTAAAASSRGRAEESATPETIGPSRGGQQVGSIPVCRRNRLINMVLQGRMGLTTVRVARRIGHGHGT